MKTDELYAVWKADPTPENEAALVAGLTRHAHAVCKLTLKTQRSDIVNNAVYLAMTKHKTFKNKSRFSTWFHAIVRKLCMSDLRDKVRFEAENLDGVLEGITGSGIEAIEARLDLTKMLKTLPELHQKILKLTLQGLTRPEIAKELGVPVHTVQNRKREALELLRDKYALGG